MDIDLSAAPRPFVLLDGVSAVRETGLRAWRQLRQVPFWHVWEAAAQCAALHQRYRCGFARHAFLLGMAGAPAAAAWGLPEGHALDGRLDLLARLTQQGDGAALYALEAVFTPAVQERTHMETMSDLPADAALTRGEKLYDAGAAGEGWDAALTRGEKPGFSVCSVADSRSRDYPSDPHFQCGIAQGEASRRARWEVRTGLCPYDGRFREERLRERYEELFRCLCRGGAA